MSSLTTDEQALTKDTYLNLMEKFMRKTKFYIGDANFQEKSSKKSHLERIHNGQVLSKRTTTVERHCYNVW